MGMIIRSNIPSLEAKSTLRKSSKKSSEAMEKLASGIKINKAADDASGLSVSKKMRAQITALETVNENNQDGVNLVQTTEGYMSEIQEMTTRMTELASKAANGVLDTEDRDALQDEMDELCAEIDRMASTANFNGVKLLGGERSNPSVAPDSILSLQIGDSSTSSDKVSMKIYDLHSDELLSSATGLPVDSDMFKVNTDVSSYKNAISFDITDQDKAIQNVEHIRELCNEISSIRSDYGALQNRLDYTITNFASTHSNLTESESRITDTNMAKGALGLTQHNIMGQAAQSMLSQANAEPQSVLDLLR
ncbi:MAG: flagellin [Oscillospiraceae bacterium]|nr:flagellin [Oscillospiraceae bacterium]